MRRCVPSRDIENPEAEPQWCIEVARDETSVCAETLCDYGVLFPAPAERREPTCAQCIAALEERS
jgi:hypothetical protein